MDADGKHYRIYVSDNPDEEEEDDEVPDLLGITPLDAHQFEREASATPSMNRRRSLSQTASHSQMVDLILSARDIDDEDADADSEQKSPDTVTDGVHLGLDSLRPSSLYEADVDAP